jgi:hypothetical protein
MARSISPSASAQCDVYRTITPPPRSVPEHRLPSRSSQPQDVDSLSATIPCAARQAYSGIARMEPTESGRAARVTCQPAKICTDRTPALPMYFSHRLMRFHGLRVAGGWPRTGPQRPVPPHRQRPLPTLRRRAPCRVLSVSLPGHRQLPAHVRCSWQGRWTWTLFLGRLSQSPSLHALNDRWSCLRVVTDT